MTFGTWNATHRCRTNGQHSPETLEELRRRHNMHTLSGNWRVRYECHVANAGGLLVIWSSNDSVAFFERTGSHDELFR